MRRFRRLEWAWACGWSLLLAGPAVAENHALLIGVTRIDALPQRLWLRGPGNDVSTMRQALLGRGFAPERITVLADAVPQSAGRPTRAAIEGAVQALVQRVQRGDQVVLHWAGHGVQVPQPADPPHPEPDGLDEVFLTADTQTWDGERQRLPQAIGDDQIGAWMDALVDRGAEVFAVFDTCHSAGMSRSEGAPVRVRSVAALELGVPAAFEVTRSRARGGATVKAGNSAAPRRVDGRVLAYAARAHESTVEEWLPRGAGLAKARLQGVFTHAVVRALVSGAASPQELRDFVLQQYRQDGRLAPVPQVVGEGRLPAGAAPTLTPPPRTGG
jgi:hypothetical protein